MLGAMMLSLTAYGILKMTHPISPLLQAMAGSHVDPDLVCACDRMHACIFCGLVFCVVLCRCACKSNALSAWRLMAIVCALSATFT
jgi:hypothetical protein